MKKNDVIKFVDDEYSIHIKRDIEGRFELVKTVKGKALSDFKTSRGIVHYRCPNCDNPYNNKMLDSEPWTGVLYCWACKCLNVIYFGDRMGGTHTDLIECYQEKTSEDETD